MKSFPLFLLIFSLFFNLSATDPAKVAYLGVHTEKLSPGTSHQLDLPTGAYLEVVYVGKESPALEAGIQSYDVLKKFDDQILINQDVEAENLKIIEITSLTFAHLLQMWLG